MHIVALVVCVLIAGAIAGVAFFVGRLVEGTCTVDERIAHTREVTNLRAKLEQARASAERWRRVARTLAEKPAKVETSDAADQADDLGDPPTVGEADRRAVDRMRENPEPFMVPKTVADPSMPPMVFSMVADAPDAPEDEARD